jgi:Ca2+-binding EF-hand superfamily protein
LKFYDVDGDGSISYEEFLSGLRDPLTERRLVMVQKAFASLDRDGSGELTTNDITGIYDVSMNPEFLEGRKTREELLNEFL